MNIPYTLEEQRQNRQTWVRALRSGKYKQGTGSLKAGWDEDGIEYCCLGVGCEVLGLPAKHGGYILNKELPSLELYKATGIPSNVEEDLTEANDNDMEDFDTISYYIENLGKVN